MCSALNLVLVDVQSCDMTAGELDHLAGRPPYAAADVEDLHAGLDVYVVGQVVLVASDGTLKRLAICESTEVEALVPPVLVQVRGQVVIPISHC